METCTFPIVFARYGASKYTSIKVKTGPDIASTYNTMKLR